MPSSVPSEASKHRQEEKPHPSFAQNKDEGLRGYIFSSLLLVPQSYAVPLSSLSSTPGRTDG
jgi:hypothetical protein